MALQLGDEAPDFTADSTEGEIHFHEYLGDGWGVLFSHPADFTPVCTTELGRVAALKPEFDQRNTRVVGLSVDGLTDHATWSDDIEEVTGHRLNFPLVADPDHQVADLYGMIHPNASDTMTVRSVFVVGPDKKVKLTLTYPAATGRDFSEILRVIDSLQLTAKHKVATPADWRQGEDVIITTAVSDDEAKERFPGYETVKPYLRKTPQPELRFTRARRRAGRADAASCSRSAAGSSLDRGPERVEHARLSLFDRPAAFRRQVELQRAAVGGSGLRSTRPSSSSASTAREAVGALVPMRTARSFRRSGPWSTSSKSASRWVAVSGGPSSGPPLSRLSCRIRRLSSSRMRSPGSPFLMA